MRVVYPVVNNDSYHVVCGTTCLNFRRLNAAINLEALGGTNPKKWTCLLGDDDKKHMRDWAQERKAWEAKHGVSDSSLLILCRFYSHISIREKPCLVYEWNGKAMVMSQQRPEVGIWLVHFKVQCGWRHLAIS